MGYFNFIQAAAELQARRDRGQTPQSGFFSFIEAAAELQRSGQSLGVSGFAAEALRFHASNEANNRAIHNHAVSMMNALCGTPAAS